MTTWGNETGAYYLGLLHHKKHNIPQQKLINVVKAIINHPPVTKNSWYVYLSQSWVVYGIESPQRSAVLVGGQSFCMAGCLLTQETLQKSDIC